MSRVFPFDSETSSPLSGRRASIASPVSDRRSSIKGISRPLDRRKSEVLSRHSFQRNSFDQEMLLDNNRIDSIRHANKDYSSDEEIRDNIHRLIQNKDYDEHEEKDYRSEVMSLININNAFSSKSDTNTVRSESEIESQLTSRKITIEESTPGSARRDMKVSRLLIFPDSLFNSF